MGCRSRRAQGIEAVGIVVTDTKMRATRAAEISVDGKVRRISKGQLVDPHDVAVALPEDAFEPIRVETAK